MSPETHSRFLVGIDLGTIHTALAYVDLAGEGDLAEAVQVLPVPQLVAPGEVGERRLLPSSAYVPGEHELPPSARRSHGGDPALGRPGGCAAPLTGVRLGPLPRPPARGLGGAVPRASTG